MGSIVIAMPKQDDARRLSDMIIRSGIWEDTVICSRGAEILHMAQEQDISVVICAKRIADMGYEELDDYLPRQIHILLLTKDPAVYFPDGRIVRLLIPFKAADLIATIRTLMPSGYYMRRRKKPPRSPEEQKIIEQAKFVLMDRNEMTEPEAFRYIQKTSMDTGRSLSETAQMILMLKGV